MNMIEIPHFGRGKDINNYVKQLLSVMHIEILWMDTQGSICVDLISQITSLPTTREKPVQYLDDTTKDKSLAEEMNKTYGIERGSKGTIINKISELMMRLETKLMSYKILIKCQKEEVLTGVIATTTQCVKGIVLIWIPYLLNSFMDDCKDA
jgi:hypothetical protein